MPEPLTLELLAFPEAVPEVRRTVREHLGAPCPEVQLRVGELLTDAIGHVGEGTPVTLRPIRAADGRTRGELADSDPHARLVARGPDEDDETGGGPVPLDALARRREVWLTPAGRTVWCESWGDAPGYTGGSAPHT